MNESTKLKTNKLYSISEKRKQLLLFGMVTVLVLIGVVFFIAFQNVRAKKISLETDIHVRQQHLVESRVYTIESWLKENVSKAQLLASSEFFQLFASEVSKLDGIPLLFSGKTDQNDDDQPSSRLPLMKNQLVEFIAYANFESGHIVNNNGDLYLSTDLGTPPLNDSQLANVKRVVETGKVVYGAVRKNQNGLALRYYLPIFPPMYEQQGGKPVSVLILAQQIGTALNSFLKLDASVKNRSLSLVQATPHGYETILASGLQIRAISSMTEFDPTLVFAIRQSTINDEPVYSMGLKLQAIDWWLIAEDKTIDSAERYKTFARTIYVLAGLATLALILLVSATWWWIIGKEQGCINEEFKKLFVVIEKQKKFLDGINNAMDDPISLTDDQGIYQYVNKAFAKAVGRKEQDVIGLDSQSVFGFDTAKRLNLSDQHVLMTGERIQIQDVLWLQSTRYTFQITKTPLNSLQDPNPLGVVSVFRDISKLIETQEHGRRVVQQTIDALVGAIEQADPFLGGHSRIMGAIASLIAKQLRLDDTDVATIEAAANLSQIGKMFVPREILLKPGTLTQEEKHLVEQHVDHTRHILQNIEFDLPVVDAICQLNERLDGKGYPKGLKDDEISIDGRILAIANAFTAMARPRAYRPALPVHEVLSILEQQAGAYDQTIVQALKEVLATPAGQKIVAQAALPKTN